MKLSLIRKEEQPVGVWAGGTTTQLAIWPEGADYASRRFDWRLSSARVELEESDFTPLPGFHRILMVLEGAIDLVHEGVRTVHLKAFDQDSFEGAWSTRSFGRCVDFNLMTGPDWTGTVAPLRVTTFPVVLFQKPADRFEALYCLCDLALSAVHSGRVERLSLRSGDFLLMGRGKDKKPCLLFDDVPTSIGICAILTTIGKK
ncbi:MAG: HutD family protein [Fretibacterium sp.]|nr:HutD family protein [Fretibacterium sp.]